MGAGPPLAEYMDNTQEHTDNMVVRSDMDTDGRLKVNYSTFLFATPTWLEGVGRLFDFGDTLTQYNDSVTSQEADYRAMQMDWRAVGADIQNAINLASDDVRGDSG